jgi:hypothetical protein
MDRAIDIVRQHEAEVVLENDRVCIAGKWFVPAIGVGDPHRTPDGRPIFGQDSPPDVVDPLVERVAMAISRWMNGKRLPQRPHWERLLESTRQAYLEQAEAAIAVIVEPERVSAEASDTEGTSTPSPANSCFPSCRRDAPHEGACSTSPSSDEKGRQLTYWGGMANRPAHAWRAHPGVTTTPVKCLLCDSEAVAIVYARNGCTCSPNKYQPRCEQHLRRAWDTGEDIVVVEDFRVPVVEGRAE